MFQSHTAPVQPYYVGSIITYRPLILMKAKNEMQDNYLIENMMRDNHLMENKMRDNYDAVRMISESCKHLGKGRKVLNFDFTFKSRKSKVAIFSPKTALNRRDPPTERISCISRSEVINAKRSLYATQPYITRQ